jgi:hypothetical protein
MVSVVRGVVFAGVAGYGAGAFLKVRWERFGHPVVTRPRL